MTPPVPPNKISELMRFLATKSKSATGPMNITELCRQFKKETGSRNRMLKVDNVNWRIRSHRGRIPKMNEFNMETKGRMMMAVWAPVDADFLKELRKEAIVDVDDCNRITRYEKKAESSDVAKQGSSSAKKKVDSKTDPSEGSKKAREDTEDSMTAGGHNEQLVEIDQKPVDLFYNDHRLDDHPRKNAYAEMKQDAPVDPENLFEEIPENRIEEEPTTSVKDLLILLRGTLMPLDSRLLNGLLRKIDGKIQKLSNGRDRQILLESVILAFDPCLYLLKTHSFFKADEESINLRNFLISLRSATCHLIHPSMDSFQQKMKVFLEELEIQNKKIPIKIVHNAMDSVINFIDP